MTVRDAAGAASGPLCVVLRWVAAAERNFLQFGTFTLRAVFDAATDSGDVVDTYPSGGRKYRLRDVILTVRRDLRSAS